MKFLDILDGFVFGHLRIEEIPSARSALFEVDSIDLNLYLILEGTMDTQVERALFPQALCSHTYPLDNMREDGP